MQATPLPMIEPHEDDPIAEERIAYWLQHPEAAPKQFDSLMFQVVTQGMIDTCDRIEPILKRQGSVLSAKANALKEIEAIRQEAKHRIGSAMLERL